MKVVPLSDQIMSDVPLLNTNCSTPISQELGAKNYLFVCEPRAGPILTLVKQSEV